MSILKDLFTGIRGKASEAGEAIVDANLATIIDQQIRDAKKEIDNATASLRNVMATASEETAKLNDLQAKVNEKNAMIQKCLDSNHEDLAREVATQLVTLKAELTAKQDLVNNLNTQVTSLKTNLHKAEENLAHIQSQAEVTKAQQSVNQARAATTASLGGSNSALASAADSLKRMNERATHQAAEMDAADQLVSEKNGDDLDAKLKAAGIMPGNTESVDDILAGFKKSETK